MTTQAERENIAAHWLIEQHDPEFSDEQREELVRWIMQSAENCHTYVKLVRTWRWTALLRRGRPPLVSGKRPPTSEAAAPSPAKPTLRKSLVDRRFGDLVRTHRVKQGMSQSDLAERTGMLARDISVIESGERSLSLTSVYLLARALEVSPSGLMKNLESLLGGKDPARRDKR
ncbi:MAG: helix-turn-helix domain-containing protein [Gammaproteobacteria bacterium]